MIVTPQQQLSRTRAYLIFALLVIAIVALHTYYFETRNYRQDEAWSVHYVLVQVADQGFLSLVTRGIYQLTSDVNVFISTWVYLFGQVEHIVRFLSTLATAVSLALVYRFAADLFDWRAGLLSVLLLGTAPLFQFFAHEARPYTFLVLGTIGLHLIFLRFLRRPRRTYAILYVVLAVATLYIHVYIIYIIAAQAVFFVLFARWNRKVYLHVAALFVATAVVSLPRLYMVFILPAYKQGTGGIEYAMVTNWDSIQLLFGRYLMLRPTLLGYFLCIVALLTPAMIYRQKIASFALRSEWQRGYLFTTFVTVLVIAFGGNLLVRNVTPRNLIVLVPALAVFAGYGISRLPTPAQVALVGLITLTVLSKFQTFVANGPYQEMTQFMAQDLHPGSRAVVDAPLIWEHVPIAYYLQERLPLNLANEDLFHIALPGQDADVASMPDPPVQLVTSVDEAALQRLNDFLGNSRQVWYIRSKDSSRDIKTALEAALKQHYIAYRSASWGDPEYPPYTEIEYRRLPDHLETLAAFAKDHDRITLESWTLENDVTVQPCQQITLDSWWQTRQTPTANYSMTLVLTDAAGSGVARADGNPSPVLMKLWQPDIMYLDERSLTIPCDLASGQYALLTSLYNYETLEALPTLQADGTPGQQYAYLTTLTVP